MLNLSPGAAPLSHPIQEHQTNGWTEQYVSEQIAHTKHSTANVLHGVGREGCRKYITRYSSKRFMFFLGKIFNLLEHRMGFEPMNTGFADQRVSHFAIGALIRHASKNRAWRKAQQKVFVLLSSPASSTSVVRPCASMV
jgi:hypothetical protein